MGFTIVMDWRSGFERSTDGFSGCSVRALCEQISGQYASILITGFTFFCLTESNSKGYRSGRRWQSDMLPFRWVCPLGVLVLEISLRIVVCAMVPKRMTSGTVGQSE
jgi:hypothetical protein